MALRCLLVGLVASLGFELPSGQEVTSWTRPGRDWVAARTITLADLQAGAPTWLGGGGMATPPAPAAPALVAEPAVDVLPDDLAFAAINEAMATSFTADFAAALAECPSAPSEQPPAPAADEVVAEVDREPEFESMALAHSEPEPPAGVDPAEPAVEVGATPAIRLNLAVRATRQAMEAWTSLVQSVGREVVAR